MQHAIDAKLNTGDTDTALRGPHGELQIPYSGDTAGQSTSAKDGSDDNRLLSVSPSNYGGRFSDMETAVAEGSQEAKLDEPALKQLQRLSKVIDRVLLRRTQLAAEERYLDDGRRLLFDSTESLKLALDAAVDEETTATPRDNIRQLHTNYSNDYYAVLHQEDLVRSSRSKLDVLEYELANAEKAIQSLLSMSANAMPDIRSRLQSENLASSRDSAASSASDTPLLVKEFWDRKGDVQIYQERLDDLDISHAESAAIRELIADRGDPLEISDEQFNEEYLFRRKDIQADLEAAEADARALQVQCEVAGYDTDPIRRTSSGSDQVLVHDWLDDVHQPQAGDSPVDVRNADNDHDEDVRSYAGDEDMFAAETPAEHNAAEAIQPAASAAAPEQPTSPAAAADADEPIVVTHEDAKTTSQGVVPLPRRFSFDQFRLRNVSNWLMKGGRRLLPWAMPWSRAHRAEEPTLTGNENGGRNC